ncbi:hypothetical protein Dimus_025123, partial [Dionaea muscipula]
EAMICSVWDLDYDDLLSDGLLFIYRDYIETYRCSVDFSYLSLFDTLLAISWLLSLYPIIGMCCMIRQQSLLLPLHVEYMDDECKLLDETVDISLIYA